jgi:RNase P subunit RPR2
MMQRTIFANSMYLLDILARRLSLMPTSNRHYVSNPEKIQDHVYVLLDAPMKAFPCAVKI